MSFSLPCHCTGSGGLALCADHLIIVLQAYADILVPAYLVDDFLIECFEMRELTAYVLGLAKGYHMVTKTRSQLHLAIGCDVDLLYHVAPELILLDNLGKGGEVFLGFLVVDATGDYYHIGGVLDMLYTIAVGVDIVAFAHGWHHPEHGQLLTNLDDYLAVGG